MFEDVINWLDRFTILVAAIAAVFSWWNWLGNRKQRKPIAIYIDRGGRRNKLPIELMRRDCSRAEVNGVLGMLHCGKEYVIEHLRTRDYFDRLQAVRNGKSDELVIEVSDNDDFNASSDSDGGKTLAAGAPNR